MASVAVGMLVAAAVVLSLGFAVALLQPATRDRIRGLFGSGSRCVAGREVVGDERLVVVMPAAPRFSFFCLRFSFFCWRMPHCFP